jgi:hypothetical protein
MATRPTPLPALPRDQIPPPPRRLPQYIPLPPLTGYPDDEQEPVETAPNYPYPPCRTIADEQRERSLEIQAMGPTAYMAQFDTRTPEDMSKQVMGVGNTEVTEGALRAR